MLLLTLRFGMKHSIQYEVDMCMYCPAQSKDEWQPAPRKRLSQLRVKSFIGRELPEGNRLLILRIDDHLARPLLISRPAPNRVLRLIGSPWLMGLGNQISFFRKYSYLRRDSKRISVRPSLTEEDLAMNSQTGLVFCAVPDYLRNGKNFRIMNSTSSSMTAGNLEV